MPSTLREQILERVDLLDVVGERVALTRKGKEFVGLCPFHDDHKPSFSVNPTKGIFKCWSCGVGGDVFKFVQLYERCDFKAALQQLAQRAGLEYRSNPAQRRDDRRRDSVRQVLAWAAEHFQQNLAGPAGAAAREYIQRRGIDQRSVDQFQLGFAADAWDELLRAARKARISGELLLEAGLVSTNERGRTYDRFRNRLIFPIRDALGRVTAFGGRTLGNDPAKYLNSPETALFNKSRVLYGYDLAREAIRRQNKVVVTEGYLDALLLRQHGIEHVVATLGTALTDAHVKVLKPFADEIVLCFDGDEAGRQAADRASELAIRQSVQTRVAIFPPGTDPADCVVNGGAAAFDAVVAAATDALEFKWQQTLATAEGELDHTRRDALAAYLRSVASACVAGRLDPIALGLLTNRISELLGLPGEEIYRLLARERQNLQRGRGAVAADGTDEPDGYRQALREVPVGLIPATEEIFGLVLEEGRLFDRLNDEFVEAVNHCETWRQLFDVMHTVVDETGTVSRQTVQARTDERDLLELVRLASARVHATPDPDAVFGGAMERLQSELQAIRIEDLNARLRGSEPAQSEASGLKALIAANRSRHGFAGLARRS